MGRAAKSEPPGDWRSHVKVLTDRQRRIMFQYGRIPAGEIARRSGVGTPAISACRRGAVNRLIKEHERACNT